MRQTVQYRQHLDAPVADVFPLICPVREAEWLPGFEYQMMHSDSGVAEPGCVFTTSRPGEPDTVWCITTHNPGAGRVEFCRVTPSLVVTHIVVQLHEGAHRRCTADITYTFTWLGDDGEAQLRTQCNEDSFLRMVQRWESSINQYLRASIG